MSQIQQIFLTSALTVIGGITIFVVGQLLSKFFIDPLDEQRKAIALVADTLIFYSNVVSSPGANPEVCGPAQDALRRCATDLMVRTKAIRWYRLWKVVRIALSKDKIIVAHENLIGLSNSVRQGAAHENREFRKAIVAALGLGDIFAPYQSNGPAEKGT